MGGEAWWVRRHLGTLGVAAPLHHLCPREEKQGGIVRSLFSVKSLNEGLQLFKIWFLFIYFWLHWVFVALHKISPVAARGGCSLVAVCGCLAAVASLAAERTVSRTRGLR